MEKEKGTYIKTRLISMPRVKEIREVCRSNDSTPYLSTGRVSRSCINGLESHQYVCSSA
nr:MAG TPA: hypothetical protein [Caudoviricetes sp.]